MKVKCKREICVKANKGKPYEWDYKGESPFYAPCPRCKVGVKLERNSK